MKKWMMRPILGWDRFWFRADGGRQMTVFRFCMGILLFVAYAVRSIDLELFYSDSGLMKHSVLPDVVPMDFRYSVFNLFPGTTALWIFNGIFLVSLLTMAFGFYPRISASIAAILHISFLHRNISVSYGVDMIATFFLLYMCFADFRRPEEKQGSAPSQDLRSIIGSVAYRLSQVQLCVIYGYSGLHKLKGVYWWKGEGVWSVLANFQMARWDFSWTAHFPLALTVASFASLFWEVYFPALIWVRPLRYPLLVFGMMMHFGIGLAMSIPFFATLMVLTYILFIDGRHLDRLSAFFKKSLWPIQVS